VICNMYGQPRRRAVGCQNCKSGVAVEITINTGSIDLAKATGRDATRYRATPVSAAI
jgi:hypothetical protein